ncbi:MAG: helix-turn-helix domain-containing protein [Streptosporangiaceae bacterium]
MKRCEDPGHRRRHHVGQRPPSPPAARALGPVMAPAPADADHISRPGAVSGAVLRGARLSAGVSEADLAGAMGISESTVRAWECGSAPLASVPLPGLERLHGALADAGADPRLVADIEVAAWCDLVIAAIASGDDTSCLMADPLARNATFSELIAWSLAGVVPARYRPYAPPGPLIAGPA